MASAPDQPRVVATYYQSRGGIGRRPQVGYEVARDGLLAAMAQHGSYDRYEVFTSDNEVEGVQRFLDGAPGRQAAALSWRELPRRADQRGISVWQNLHMDEEVPLSVRARFSREPFPIVLVNYTFSYREILHDRFLRQLLSDLQPCDSYVCTSQAARTAMRNLFDHVSESFEERHGVRLEFRGRLDQIPLGVDTDVLRPRDRRDARIQLGLPPEPLILLWVGRISAREKADLLPLLDAFRDVSASMSVLGDGEEPPMLLIAGSDPYKEAAYLERYAHRSGIADRVRVVAGFDTPSRALFYSAADIFVSPADSVQEAYGLTPVEAMACGIPQVVADWDGYRETVSDGETGLLVPTTWARCDSDLSEAGPLLQLRAVDHLMLAQSVSVDPVAFRRALLQLMMSEEERNRMAEASRRRAEQHFSWSTVIPRYEALWAELRQVANAINPSTIRPPLLETRFFDAFHHYATRILEDRDVLCRSPSGDDALRRPESLEPRYGTVDGRVLVKLLDALGTNGCDVAELLRRAEGEGRSNDDLRRHVMWLLKYGLARPA